MKSSWFVLVIRAQNTNTSHAHESRRRITINNLRIRGEDGWRKEGAAKGGALVDPPYRKHAPSMVQCADGRTHLLLEGKIWAKPSGIGCGIGTAPITRRPQPTTGMFDPVQRLKDMDMEG